MSAIEHSIATASSIHGTGGGDPAAIATADAVLGARVDRVGDELVRDVLDLPEAEFLALVEIRATG
jgi:hypothetical protein